MKRVTICLVSFIGITSAVGARFENFDLTDQYQNLRRYHFPKTKLTLMVVADNKGSADLRTWIGCTYRQFGSTIDIDGIADVSTVPTLLQSIIRTAFRKQVQHSVMLDWNGSVVRQFEFVKGESNLYLLDLDGTVIGHISGPPDVNRLNILFKTITATLERKRSNE